MCGNWEENDIELDDDFEDDEEEIVEEPIAT